MIGYLAQRILQAAGVLLGVSIITFLLAFLLPADPARMIAGRSATVATVESIRDQLGLNRPLPQQYASYLGNIVQGDFGRSYVQKADLARIIQSRLKPTLQLALVGIDSLRQTKVGDNLDRIVAVLDEAVGRADAVIVCGGLGRHRTTSPATPSLGSWGSTSSSTTRSPCGSRPCSAGGVDGCP